MGETEADGLPVPPPGKYWLIDETTRYAKVRRQLEQLGGLLKRRPNSWAWEFASRESFERADLIVNTFQDQTIIADPNTVFIRDMLLATSGPYTRIYGGTERKLSDGSYAVEFPSVEQAANAMALLYEARQLRPEHKVGLSIVNEFLGSDRLRELYGFDPIQDATRLDTLDRHTTSQIFAGARPTLHRLGISSSHAHNLTGANIVREILEIEDFKKLSGFDPVAEPHRFDALTQDPIATAKLVVETQPMLHELGLSSLHSRNVARAKVVQESLNPELFQETFGLDPVLNPDRYDALLQDPIATAKFVATGVPLLRERGINVSEELRADRGATDETRAAQRAVEQVAQTAMAGDELRRDIGGYVEQERDRVAARNDELNLGPERFGVLQTAREVLDREGKNAQVIGFDPGDWIQGRIIAYNRGITDENNTHDVMRQFVAVEVVSKSSTRVNSWTRAPEGTRVERTSDRLTLTRPDDSTTTYDVATIRGDIKIAQREGRRIAHGQTYSSVQAARTQLAHLARSARASASSVYLRKGETGIAIIPVASFADQRFREEMKIRIAMSNNGSPISLGYQPNGEIAYIQAHVNYARGSILQGERLEHVVERPATQEQRTDYEAVVALARSQIAGNQKHWKGIDREPNTIRERAIISDSGRGYECQVLNIGKYYLATKIRDAIAVHELAAFDAERTFAIGEKFGVIYEDGFPREFTLDRPPNAPFKLLPPNLVENMPGRSDELTRILGLDPGEGISGSTRRLLDQQAQRWETLVLSFMDRAREALALHEARSFAKDATVFRPYQQERDRIDGDVIAIDTSLKLAAVTYGEYFTTVNLRHLPTLSLDLRDHVNITVSDGTLTVEEHISRQQRIERYTREMRLTLAKEAQVAPETIMLRPSGLENDLYHGVVMDVNPQLQYAAVAAGSRSIATFDLAALDQTMARGDEVTIVTREQQHYVTRRLLERDRDLVPEAIIRKELEQRLELSGEMSL